MLNVPGTLLTAIQHQQAARYAEAETLYRAVLADDPDHPHAIYLYGLLQLGTGQTAAAVENLGRAAARRSPEFGRHCPGARAMQRPCAVPARHRAQRARSPRRRRCTTPRGD